MHTYTNDELTRKIHTFLHKKSQKYPEIGNVQRPRAQKIHVREAHKAAIVSIFDTLNNLWAQRLRSL